MHVTCHRMEHSKSLEDMSCGPAIAVLFSLSCSRMQTAIKGCVHTDPDSLPSFADKCSFGNWSSGYTSSQRHSDHCKGWSLLVSKLA